MVVKDLIDSNNDWNIHLLRNTFNNNVDIDCILKIYIPQNNRKDGET